MFLNSVFGVIAEVSKKKVKRSLEDLGPDPLILES